MVDEKKRSEKLVLFLILVIAILASSVTYAASSSYLETKGTARIENYKWNVHFDNLQNSKLIGEVIENKKPSFNEYKTIISGFDVTFKNPSDKVIYEFDIVNDGDFDAIVSSIVVTKPTCLSKSKNELNEKEFCENLKYNLEYEDGTRLNINDSLDKKTTKKVKLILDYQKNQFPDDEIEMNDISITISYSQK